jgi:hypothetical protein
MMHAVLLHCPHLGRDIAPILESVPGCRVLHGVPVTPGEAGCLQMHQDAVQLAIEQRWPRVTVIEDDCHFTPAFRWADWLRLCARADGLEAGALVGGTVRAHCARLVAPGLLSVDKCCSAHFVTHFSRGYQAVLDAVQPFDLSFTSMTKTLVAWPFVAIQSAGLSGIGLPRDAGDSQRYTGPQPVDYSRHFARTEAKLARLGA